MGVHPAWDTNLPVQEHDKAKSKEDSLMPSKSKEQCHRSVLEQMAKPAKFVDSCATVPAKKSLRVGKHDAHEQSHKNCWSDPRTSNSVQTTLRNMEKSGA